MKKFSIALSLVALLIAGCGDMSKKQNNTNTNPETKEAERQAKKESKILKDSSIQSMFGEGLYAQFHITEGDVLVKLEMERAPLTVANFVALAEGAMPNNAKEAGEPFYDGLTFHRVISVANGDNQNFMIQGGDPMGNGQGGPGYQFRDEFHPELRHSTPGILSMANSGPASNGSQFFITIAPTPHLDNIHSIFGKVIQGQDRVFRTLQGDKIKWLAIIRVGDAAKAFDAMKIFNTLKDGPANS